VSRGDPDHIRARLRRFRASVPDEAVAAARRPATVDEPPEIVVPCFDHGAFLADALASIEAQTWRGTPLAVTLVDDNSTDGSLAEMRRLERAADPDRLRVRVLANDRSLYQAGSLNRAIESSASELFVVLNADDLLVPDCVQTIVETYRRAAGIFMLGGGSLAFADASALPPREALPAGELSLAVTDPAQVLGFTTLNELNMTQSSCSFFRSAWVAAGGYAPPELRVCGYDDRDFQLRVASLFPVGVLDYPLAYYRTTSSQGRWAL
jgi:GT2 family glycosyltransferase